MIIQLEIPKEFECDYENDRFVDFFNRVLIDISDHGFLCGNYESETAQMMHDAFEHSIKIK